MSGGAESSRLMLSRDMLVVLWIWKNGPSVPPVIAEGTSLGLEQVRRSLTKLHSHGKVFRWMVDKGHNQWAYDLDPILRNSTELALLAEGKRRMEIESGKPSDK